MDDIQLAEQQQRASALISLALARKAGGDPSTFQRAFERRSGTAYSHLVKSAVDTGTVADWGLAPALSPLKAAFVGQVNLASIVGPLLAAGMQSVPLSAATRILISPIAAASTVLESGQKPIRSLSFTLDTTAPEKCVAEIVYSQEAARSADPAMMAAVTNALVSACALAVDAALVARFTGSGGIAATGASAATVGALLAAISGGSPQRPVLIGSYSDLCALAPTLADLQQLGVVVVPCASAAGFLIAVDAAGGVFGEGGAQVSEANAALVTMDDGSGSPASTRQVNLWSENLIALRAERWYQFAGRADAIAFASTLGSP